MYCRNGQQTEEEMYNNEEGGAAFNEFLELIGQKVRLKGFNKYKAGLCNKSKFFWPRVYLTVLYLSVVLITSSCGDNWWHNLELNYHLEFELKRHLVVEFRSKINELNLIGCRVHIYIYLIQGVPG